MGFEKTSSSEKVHIWRLSHSGTYEPDGRVSFNCQNFIVWSDFWSNYWVLYEQLGTILLLIRWGAQSNSEGKKTRTKVPDLNFEGKSCREWGFPIVSNPTGKLELFRLD